MSVTDIRTTNYYENYCINRSNIANEIDNSNVTVGVFYVFIGTILIVVYIPFLIAIATATITSNDKKLLLFMGFVDIGNQLITSYVSGYYMAIGAHYCDHTRSMIIFGYLSICM